MPTGKHVPPALLHSASPDQSAEQYDRVAPGNEYVLVGPATKGKGAFSGGRCKDASGSRVIGYQRGGPRGKGSCGEGDVYGSVLTSTPARMSNTKRFSTDNGGIASRCSPNHPECPGRPCAQHVRAACTHARATRSFTAANYVKSGAKELGHGWDALGFG